MKYSHLIQMILNNLGRPNSFIIILPGVGGSIFISRWVTFWKELRGLNP